MMRRIIPAVTGLALLAAACGPADVEVSDRPAAELGFIPQVVDAESDAGAGLSATLDAEGNPHYAYLAFERAPAAGEPPPALDPLAPALPAVKHAHLVGGVWTRTVVAEEAGVSPDDETAIAVDAEGVHHVAWTEGGEILYSNTAAGAFSEPETVADGPVSGLSITAQDGEPRIAFYEETGPEGPGFLVRVAAPDGNRWAVETAAEAGAAEPRTTGLGVADGQVLVAYGSEGSTLLARSGDVWASEVADAAGGLGVSLALDGDGNPHLAYYGPSGEVRLALSAGPGQWETSSVADAGGAPEPDWSTSIALNADGARHVAWQESGDIGFATDAGGSFETMDVRGGQGGLLPRVAAGADALFLAWYDTDGLALIVATLSEEEPLLAAPPGVEEQPVPGPTPGPEGGEEDGEPVEGGVAVSLRSFAVEANPATAEAGEVTFVVTSEDSLHNFFLLRTDEPEDGLAVEAGIVDLAQYEVAAEIPDGFTPDDGPMTVTADLQSGRYVMICNIPGHYQSGMFTVFTVE